jgi:4-amino-4-deoxy-L-arabinose transferase-like glycosyltransferase
MHDAWQDAWRQATDRWRRNVRWRSESVALASAIVLGVLFRLGTLRLPLDRDEGAYATIGRGWTSGIIPYRDVFDHKPPVIYAFYALADRLAPASVLSVRVLSSALFVLALVLVFAVTRRVYGGAAAAFSAVAFALIGNDFTVEAARANTEQVMLPSLVASLYCFVRAGDGTRPLAARWLLAAGVFAGIAVLTKPVAIWPLAVLAVAAAWPGAAEARATASLRALAAIVAGAAIPVAAAAAYFAANGALDDARADVLSFNSAYVRYFWDNGYRGQVTDLSPLASPYAMIAFASLFTTFALPRESRRGHAVILLWTASNVVGAKMGVRTFGHYFVPALPGIAMLSAAFVIAVARLTGQASGQSPAPAWQRFAPAAAALAIAGGWQARENVQFAFLAGPDTQVRREFGEQGPMLFARAGDVSLYLRQATAPDDLILVWGAEAEVYYLSGRPAASRYIYGISLGFARDSVDTMRRDLEAARPRAVVVPTNGGIANPAVLGQQGYVPTYTAGWFQVYEPAELAPASNVASLSTTP